MIELGKPLFASLLVLACTALIPSDARACGTWLEHSLLDSSDAELCEALPLAFATYVPSLPAPERRFDRDQLGAANNRTTINAEYEDLRVALAALGSDSGAVTAISEAMIAYREHIADEQEPELPSGLPREFELYLQGARAWHRNDHALARERWQALLELPVDRRRHRSVWAAYMLGRLAGPCSERARWFQHTRTLAATGFADSLGLAAASWGEQAQCWLQPDTIIEAIELYRVQAETGDRWAIVSLEQVAGMILRWSDDDLELLERLAGHPLARELLTAYLISHHARADEQGWTQRWLLTLEQAELELDEGAGELAWLAYQTGAHDRAARWAERGGDQDLLGRWVSIKLALRRVPLDQLDELQAELALLEQELRVAGSEVELLDHRLRWAGARPLAETAAAELALVALRSDAFDEALAALLRTESWIDAAYLAEQVLTLDELQRFVDARPPTGSAQIVRLRWLLARRLARADRWSDALPYYPAEHRDEVERHIEDLRRGDDPTLADVDRARALWWAALRMRELGMELRGTEVEPDWAYYDGRFAATGVGERREHAGPTLTAPSRRELERVQAHRDRDMQRFHYRWIAFELGMRAAELLPDDHEATTRVLCQAGRWIEQHDPATAERAYHAIVRRNPNIALAQQADRRRWFPSGCSLAGIDFAAPAFTRAPDEGSLVPTWVRSRWPFALVALLGLLSLAVLFGGRERERG